MNKTDKITPANIEAKLNSHTPKELPDVMGYQLFTFLFDRKQNVAALAHAFGMQWQSMAKYYRVEKQKRLEEQVERKELLEKLDSLWYYQLMLSRSRLLCPVLILTFSLQPRTIHNWSEVRL